MTTPWTVPDVSGLPAHRPRLIVGLPPNWHVMSPGGSALSSGFSMVHSLMSDENPMRALRLPSRLTVMAT